MDWIIIAAVGAFIAVLSVVFLRRSQGATGSEDAEPDLFRDRMWTPSTSDALADPVPPDTDVIEEAYEAGVEETSYDDSSSDDGGSDSGDSGGGDSGGGDD